MSVQWWNRVAGYYLAADQNFNRRIVVVLQRGTGNIDIDRPTANGS